MLVSDFDFDLPPELIAERPAQPREAARLLHYAGGIDPRALTVADLPALLRAGDLLVFNDTKVIPARLFGRRERGPAEVKVEALLLKALGGRRWTAMAKPARRLQPGDRILLDGAITAEMAGRSGAQLELVFERDAAELLAARATCGAGPP